MDVVVIGLQEARGWAKWRAELSSLMKASGLVLVEDECLWEMIIFIFVKVDLHAQVGQI